MDKIKNYVSNPSAQYSIKNELEVRKWLEAITGINFEFRRNDNQYGYDILCYAYSLVNSNKFKQYFNCFIEIEDTPQWTGKTYPPKWRNYQFLRRKIDVFDYNANQYTNQLKPNANNTIYLKVAGDFSDMCSARIIDIKKNGKKDIIKGWGNDIRKASIYSFPLIPKHPAIARGKDQCAEQIIQFVNRNSTNA